MRTTHYNLRAAESRINQKVWADEEAWVKYMTEWLIARQMPRNDV